jgi:hypothetical protein
MASSVIERVRRETRKPIFAKLSPNVSRIGEMAKAVEEAGADGITAVNTVLGMKIDWRTRRPGLYTVQGGYSGTAIKPIALRCAWECARSVKIPVIGCGGIVTADECSPRRRAGRHGTASRLSVGRAGRLPRPTPPGRDRAELIGSVAADGGGRAPEGGRAGAQGGRSGDPRGRSAVVIEDDAVLEGGACASRT